MDITGTWVWRIQGQKSNSARQLEWETSHFKGSFVLFVLFVCLFVLFWYGLLTQTFLLFFLKLAPWPFTNGERSSRDHPWFRFTPGTSVQELAVVRIAQLPHEGPPKSEQGREMGIVGPWIWDEFDSFCWAQYVWYDYVCNLFSNTVLVQNLHILEHQPGFVKPTMSCSWSSLHVSIVSQLSSVFFWNERNMKKRELDKERVSAIPENSHGCVSGVSTCVSVDDKSLRKQTCVSGFSHMIFSNISRIGISAAFGGLAVASYVSEATSSPRVSAA